MVLLSNPRPPHPALRHQRAQPRTSSARLVASLAALTSPLGVAIVLGLFGFGISLTQLAVPEFVGFYVSGVYVGAVIHFVNGVMPYRDFTFPQTAPDSPAPESPECRCTLLGGT